MIHVVWQSLSFVVTWHVKKYMYMFWLNIQWLELPISRTFCTGPYEFEPPKFDCS